MKKIIVFLIGIIILAFGTALCNYTGLGIDPFNAFCIAVSQQSGIQLGTVTLLIQLVIGGFIFIFKRENIGVGSVIPIVSFGYILEFFTWLIEKNLEPITSIFTNLFVFILGALIITFGMSIYMECNMGMVPYDSIAYALVKYFKGEMAIFRMILDTIIAVTAFLLNGPINVGTVILAFSVGPLISFFRDKFVRCCFNRLGIKS